ncbi:flagellin Hag [Planomicrobium sp. MB-3u-38]|uniref:flagellin Hag n=1 Tax=Planomicrobium sp. MB-3u-38 TaxID=2058318 RepID=UPI000C7E4216|nr:flagellin Hag [Planomicrobium sp. MB-3u-38]PKH10356.1 flagellin [Planomicrobium sp. MB-3u-38]
MIINNNIAALNTHRQMGQVSGAAQNSMEKLSSGLRINKAADDAAGFSISEKMRNQIRGMDQAQRNAQDGISLIQTAEGGLNETHSILQRVRELVVQAGNGTNNDEERTNIQSEIGQLVEEIDSIAGRTEFNGKNLLEGGLAAGSGVTGVTLQVGANSTQQLTFNIEDMTSTGLGTGSGSTLSDLSVSGFGTLAADASGGGFDAQLKIVDDAIKQVSDQRSTLGAVQNRLDHTINNLATSAENLTSAESRIKDVDMAKEMMNFTKNNILTQASQAMLAQANQQPQAVLQLLR